MYNFEVAFLDLSLMSDIRHIRRTPHLIGTGTTVQALLKIGSGVEPVVEGLRGVRQSCGFGEHRTLTYVDDMH